MSTPRFLVHPDGRWAVRYLDGADWRLFDAAGREIGLHDPREPGWSEAVLAPWDRAEDVDNNLLAAGAVLMILRQQLAAGGPLKAVSVVLDDHGNPTNQLQIKLSFMKSPYRLVVERFDGGEEQ